MKIKSLVLSVVMGGLLILVSSISNAQDVDTDGNLNGVITSDFLAIEGVAATNSKPALCFQSVSPTGFIEGWAIEARTSHLFISERSCFEASGETGIFQMHEGAKSSSFNITESGIGMGDAFGFALSSILPTEAPQRSLHIKNDSGGSGNWDATGILIEDINSVSATRELFTLVNNGGVRFGLENTASSEKWFFATDNNGKFNISVDGSGGPEISVTPAGRVFMGPGTVKNFDLRTNGDLHIEGTLFESSDRNKKKAFEIIDQRDILNRVVGMPISTWQYKGDEAEMRHLGPTAQDFRAAFELGESETSIATIDGIGVSLAAIQGLNQKLELKDQEIVQLTGQVKDQQQQLAQQQELINQMLNRLEALENQPE